MSLEKNIPSETQPLKGILPSSFPLTALTKYSNILSSVWECQTEQKQMGPLTVKLDDWQETQVWDARLLLCKYFGAPGGAIWGGEATESVFLTLCLQLFLEFLLGKSSVMILIQSSGSDLISKRGVWIGELYWTDPIPGPNIGLEPELASQEILDD